MLQLTPILWSIINIVEIKFHAGNGCPSKKSSEPCKKDSSMCPLIIPLRNSCITMSNVNDH